MGKSSCCIIIPTINEEGTIGAVLDGLGAGKNAIVVDGGSGDRTRDIASGRGARVIVEARRGNGAAFRKGFSESRSKYVASIDGDGTYPAGALRECLGIIEREGADAVFGDRLSKKGNYIRPARRAGNIAMTFFINALFGTRIADTQSGLCVFRRSSLARNMPKSDGMSHCQEMKIRLACSGHKCISHPIAYADRQKGSKFRFFKDGFALGIGAVKLRIGLL
ncbi:MAG: glycosyltransferase family 2 protein [Candidatus Micrarchaeia archaeon]